MKKNITVILFVVIFAAIVIQVSRLDILDDYFENYENTIFFDDAVKSDIPEGYVQQKALIIFDKEWPDGERIVENIEKTIEYLHVDITKVDFREVDESSLNQFDFVVSAFEAYYEYTDFDKFIDYISNGGRVFVAVRPLYDENQIEKMELLGFYDLNSEVGAIDTQGIKMRENVLVKFPDIEVEEGFIINSSLPCKINSNAILLANSNDGIPLLWEVSNGKGRVVLFNGTMLDDKINRGIIVGSISRLVDDFIYPIINASVNFLDDFPSPVPQGYNQSLKNELGVSIPEFYNDIWWPFMIKEKSRYDLKYTGVLIQNYSKTVEPPFDDDSVEGEKSLILFGAEIIKGGDEMGIHGYNHQSLAPEGYIKEDLGYNSWASQEHMEQAVKTVYDFTKEVYKNYSLQAYVPPSNILSEEGRNALINQMPDLKIISSLYVKDEGESSYIQEFEVKDGIVEFPRLTSGYLNDSETKWNIANGVTSVGVFSHFVHPDDFLDEERSKNLTWRQAEEQFDAIQKLTHNNYAWLESKVASEAANQTIKYLDAEIYLYKEENKINVFINNYREDINFILRSEKELKSYNNCEIMKIDENYYHVIAENQSFTIEFK